VIDLANLAPGDFEAGRVNASCGQAFVDYIRASARLALDGDIDAIASAPTNKEAMHAAGHLYAGQTEVFAEATDTKNFFTVLTGGKVKVFLVSSHVSLREAIDLVKPERVERVIRIAREALRELWHVENPKLAVAGLNPHAGDGGLFGREEIEHVIPVMQRLSAEGFDLVGPGPADSLYYAAEQGAYDGVIGMYHDQGVIPLKRYGYVTVIAGTPIIRTTAGHGTAYDIAGQGIAKPDVLIRAIQLAAELADLRRRAPR
jgi:4-phospho-D-threonate 3-dehydrogenase / 4-phospho-D-erythronate 3-dehydrogenase